MALNPEIKLHKLALHMGKLLDADRPHAFLNQSNKLISFLEERKAAGPLSNSEQETYDYLINLQESCRDRPDMPKRYKVLGKIELPPPEDYVAKAYAREPVESVRAKLETAFLAQDFAEMENLANNYLVGRPYETTFVKMKVVAQISQQKSVDPELLEALSGMKTADRREVYGMLMRAPIDRAIERKDYKLARKLLSNLMDTVIEQVGAYNNFNTLFPESRILPSANRWPGKILAHLSADTELDVDTLRRGLSLSRLLLTEHLGTLADNREQNALAAEFEYKQYLVPLDSKSNGLGTREWELAKRDERWERETGFER